MFMQARQRENAKRRPWTMRSMAAGLLLAGLAAWPGVARAQQVGGDLERKLSRFVEETLATNDPLVLAAEGETLAPEEAAQLETRLTLRQGDLPTHSRLLGFYTKRAAASDQARQERRRHVFWLIEHEPASEIAGSRYAALDPTLDKEDCAKARDLWLEQAQLHARQAAVLRNAGDFLMTWDLASAERLYRQGATVEPGNPDWPARLGMLYTLHSRSSNDAERAALGRKALAAYDEALAKAKQPDRKLALLAEAARDGRRRPLRSKQQGFPIEL
jgi:hypothetical protein